VHPGVTGWITATPTPASGWLLGDWNCDGVVQFEFQGGINCPGLDLSSLGGQTCADVQGFMGAQPGCGTTSGTFVQCQAALLGLPLTCTAGAMTTVTQGCL
jgi:hypothetical protein